MKNPTIQRPKPELASESRMQLHTIATHAMTAAIAKRSRPKAGPAAGRVCVGFEGPALWRWRKYALFPRCAVGIK